MPIITNFQKNFNEKKKLPPSKVAGIILLVIATVGYIGLFIKWIPFLHNFLLGTFGLFSYVLFLMMYIIGGALLKGAKYVFSKRYIVYLCMALISILAVFHIGFTFNMQLSSYGAYLSEIYTSGVSVGGVLLGIIIYPLQKFLFPLGALFLFLILLTISIWLIYDYLTRVRYIKKADTKIFNKKVEKVKQDKVKTSLITIEDTQIAPKTKIGLDAEIEKEQSSRQQALEKLGLDKSVRNERFVESKELNSFATDFLNDNRYGKQTRLERPTDYSGTFGYNMVDSKKTKPKSSNYEKNMEFLEATLSGKAYAMSSQPTTTNYQTKKSDVTMEDFINANFGDSKEAEQSFINKKYEESQAINNQYTQNTQSNDFSSDYQTSYNNQNSLNSNQSNLNNNLHDDLQTGETPSQNASNEQDLFDMATSTKSSDAQINSFNSVEDARKLDKIEPEQDVTKSIEEKIDEVKPAKNEIDLSTFELPPSLKSSSSSRRRGFKFNENQTDMFGVNSAINEEKPKPHIFKKYVNPTIDLLSQVSVDTDSYNQDCEHNALAIEQTLENFGIPAKVNNTTIGPAVTRFELNMPAGISVNMVTKYSNDISAAVASSRGVRIQAPIPGKSAVGVEVPNKKIAMVSIREILESKEFLYNKNTLSYAVGKEVSGKSVVADMHEMPHMLVAGSTGSGKSVALNTIIISMIYKYGPEDLRFILVDPKQVEFYMYNGLPHLLMPEAIIDPAKSLNALDWAIGEMERRYALLRESGVREIMEYNELPEVKNHTKEKLAHIVIIIDEVGDIMTLSNVKKDFEEKVRRLTQKARAIGINLILATQRPSVDVITGVIKANLPSRMAFAVQNYQDSKTILDTGGADKLLGKGDMLFSPRGIEPFRVQGCFISTKEIHDVVEFVKSHNESYYDESISKAINKDDDNDSADSGDIGGKEGGEFDPLMPEALKLVIKTGCASASMLQRRFSIGNPKAARIIDQMEQHKFVGGPNGSKPRAVYITAEQFKELFGEDVED